MRTGKEEQRLLITGGSGLIGRPLLEALQGTGKEIHAVGRKVSCGGVDGGVFWHRADLLSDPVGVVEEVRPTGLIHLAWEAKPGSGNNEVNEAWLESSQRLIEVFRENGGRRLLVAGTCFEYGDSEEPLGEEETPLTGASLYGRCKVALYRWLGESDVGRELSWIWPRIYFVYGPGEDSRRLVASVILSLLAGERAECSHGRQVRDYMYSRDVAEGLLALFESGGEGACNLASGERTTIGEVARAAAAEVGAPELLALGAREAPENEPSQILADLEKLRSITDWRPRFTLAEGMRETVHYWKSRCFLSS